LVAPHSTLAVISWVLVLAVVVPASCLALGIALLKSIQWSSASRRNMFLTLAGLAAIYLVGFAVAAAFSPFSWDAALYLVLGLVWSGAAFGHWHRQRHVHTGTGNRVAP
jgi:hypothetical protein